MTASDSKGVAAQLRDWFLSVFRLAEASLFSVAPEGPHRDAVVLDTLKRNARILSQAELDNEGKLYSPLCFFLAAACWKLGTSLGAGHWRAAIDNVIDLRNRLVGTREESYAVGLDIGSPAVVFKREFDESIRQSGLAGGVSYLDKEDRAIALGLAINWGMRLLIAYALECAHTNGSDRKDLAWVASVVRPLLTTFGTSKSD
ncbi:MAG: hypothetical protein ACLQU1_12620 [Bryobacteraceae bacterium]